LDMGSDRRVHMVGVHGIGECPLLGSLILNCCKYLREIKGIPPTLRCENESLTSSSRSMLLNQVFFLVSSESGFHLLKHEGSMEDVQFTNPFL
jgi:hypothetical protein